MVMESLVFMMVLRMLAITTKASVKIQTVNYIIVVADCNIKEDL